MSGSPLAPIVIPIVVGAALFVFIALVFHADRHPGPGRGGTPDRDITGGIFHGDPRQQMPRRDAPPKAATGQGSGGSAAKEHPLSDQEACQPESQLPGAASVPGLARLTGDAVWHRLAVAAVADLGLILAA
jgi:hypothetical protein